METQPVQSFQAKTSDECNPSILHVNGIDLNDGDRYVMADHGKLKLVARAVILVLMLVAFFMLRTPFGASSSVVLPDQVGYNSDDLNLFSLLFRDLSNEGLFKDGDKAIFLSGRDGDDNAAIDASQIVNDADMDVVSASDFDQQTMIHDESFDLAFSYNYHIAPEFIDRTLKVGGIVVVQLSDDPSFAFIKPSNYKIIYFRRFRYTVMAMRKMGLDDANLATQRKLLGYTTEARKAALQNLEDVLLEPPRAASGKSSRYLKRTRYLPDLTGDSLESYPRRVFIDVGLPEKQGGSGTGWFAKHYPTRNLDFEVYKIETVTEESSGKEVPQVREVGMSDWLRKNVKAEEYVVMKAEAEVVEEMVKSKAIRLVDELFLECKPRGHGGKTNGSGRAYWECLALYGKLRDEGVAVHQWWG